MKSSTYGVEPLFEMVESYVETNLELYKLKTLNKSSTILSSLVSRGLAVVFLSLFIITISIGGALWLGELFGKLYYGFFCVAGFYGLLGAIVYFVMHRYIKRSVKNSIIAELLN